MISFLISIFCQSSAKTSSFVFPAVHSLYCFLALIDCAMFFSILPPPSLLSGFVQHFVQKLAFPLGV